MSLDPVDELRFRAADGFELVRLLEERDRYHDLVVKHRLSLLLDFMTNARDAVVTVRLRRPSGIPFSEMFPDAPVPLDTLATSLVALEQDVPHAFAHLHPSHVYVEARTGQVGFHGPLLGWHRAQPGHRASADVTWGAALARASGTGTVARQSVGASSFSELAEALAAAGLIAPIASPGSTTSRAEWLRRHGKALLPSDPRGALAAFEESFELEADPDTIHRALGAAIRVSDTGAFDRLMDRARTRLNQDSFADLDGFRAWRAMRAGDHGTAEQLARQALSRVPGAELPLKVLCKTMARAGKPASAGELAIELIVRYPTAEYLRTACELADRLPRPELVRLAFDAFPLPVTDPSMLLRRARLEVHEGLGARAFLTLHAVATSAAELGPVRASDFLDVAESAARASAGAGGRERVLQLIHDLAGRSGWNDELRFANAFYLLDANLDREVHGLLDVLPDDPRTDHIRSMLAFRSGDLRAAKEAGQRARRRGVRSADLDRMLRLCDDESDAG